MKLLLVDLSSEVPVVPVQITDYVLKFSRHQQSGWSTARALLVHELRPCPDRILAHRILWAVSSIHFISLYPTEWFPGMLWLLLLDPPRLLA